jgi:hypothetical protein
MGVISHIKKHRQMYLGRDEIIPEIIISYLVWDALSLGVSDVIVRHKDDWWGVGAKEDWLLKGHDKSIEEIFFEFFPLPGGGQNSFRREPVVSAFSTSIATTKRLDANIIVIQGEYCGSMIHSIIDEYPLIERVLAIRF